MGDRRWKLGGGTTKYTKHPPSLAFLWGAEFYKYFSPLGFGTDAKAW